MIEQILKLIDAGYTKEEIAGLLGPEKAEPEKRPAEPEKAAAPENPEPRPEVKAEPDEDYITKLVNARFAEAEAKINDMIKKANIFTIPEVKPITDISDIITNFFKED